MPSAEADSLVCCSLAHVLGQASSVPAALAVLADDQLLRGNKMPRRSGTTDVTQSLAGAIPVFEPSKLYFVNRSLIACFITCPDTAEMELVSGMSLGQTSTQFCA